MKKSTLFLLITIGIMYKHICEQGAMIRTVERGYEALYKSACWRADYWKDLAERWRTEALNEPIKKGD